MSDVGRNLAAGGALLVVGGAMAVAARDFPTVGGMTYGPGLFPTIISCGLVASGLGIVLEAVRTGPAARLEPKRRPRLLPMAGVLAVIAFFALALNPLGFHVTAAISLLIAVRIFGGRWRVAVSLAVIGTAAVHFLFYSVLRVPLPWGLMLPIAW